MISIEVVYATPEKQKIINLQVPVGTSIEAAIKQSGILTEFTEINLTQQKVGIFSKPRVLSDIVQAGDRIEIYRPLLIDPKEARRIKARSSKKI